MRAKPGSKQEKVRQHWRSRVLRAPERQANREWVRENLWRYIAPRKRMSI